MLEQLGDRARATALPLVPRCAVLDTAIHLLCLWQEDGQEGHPRRTMARAEQLARALRLPARRVRAVRWGAALHDIGKEQVPPAILQKPGPLDPLEQQTIRQHPDWGVARLAGLPWLPQETLHAVRHHHERWDGQGYPLGLYGSAIPLSARIVALADVYDALTNRRVYKAAWTTEQAALYLLAEVGRQFDPELTRLFVGHVLGFPHLLAWTRTREVDGFRPQP
ncbi:HD-GYP domain-containing protein [Deinococcus sp. YIM 77859]|uniref:HD-GYP domain-containing protein n=1 Tax=Deinococcus sp. YIM 77859 TaxID=1540221 RepID=UPI00068E1379|nr:HD-GYP domain-containing protein [Deinococcus sp. YIM 77859]